MSGPMQWSQEAGKLVPTFGSSASPPPIESSQDDDDDSVFEQHLHARSTSPTPSVKASPSAPRSKTLSPTDVVQLAKNRLKDIKQELRRMKALEKERDQLERLIKAAGK